MVIGYSADLLSRLDSMLPANSVAVVEELEVIEHRGVRDHIDHFHCLGAVIPAPTQDEANAERLVGLVARPGNVRAVVPASDHGVIAAATLATAWNLPGVAVHVARLFRDKALLREAVYGTGIAQPEWHLVHGPDDVAVFRMEHGGTCVLKPTNSRASTGVQLLGADDDLIEAWQQSTTAQDLTSQPAHAPVPRYMVEETLRGPEISGEVLVRNGQVCFFNATAKTVLLGRNPVEMGHSVPAPNNVDVNDRLERSMHALVAATGFTSGVLHAEWVIIEGVPHFVECGARLPGDYIVDLIDMAHGWSLLKGFFAVLAGDQPDVPDRRLRRGAAIRYLSPEPGVVTAVDGVDHARSLDGVREVLVRVASGDSVKLITSSWKRPGHVIATGPDPVEAARRAELGLAAITIETNQSSE